MMRILLLIPFIISQGCVSLTDFKETFDAIKVNEQKISDSKIAIVLESENVKLCISDDQAQFLKDTLSKYFTIKEDEKITIKIKDVSTSNSGFSIFNLTATTLTYGIIPLYGSAKYEIEIKIFNDKRLRVINDQFYDASFVGVLLLPFAHNTFKIRKKMIEQTIRRMSVKTSDYIPVDTVDFNSTRSCNGIFYSFFIRQKWY